MTQEEKVQATLARTARLLAQVDKAQATRKANVARMAHKPKRELPPSLKGNLNGGGRAFSLLKQDARPTVAEQDTTHYIW